MTAIFMPEASYCLKASTSGAKGDGPRFLVWILVTIGLIAIALSFLTPEVFAQAQLPGSDASDKLEAAGTLLRLLDTGIFTWGARLMAGVCILSSGLAFKEQNYAVAVVCVMGAIVIGTAPHWVANIFEIGGGSVFGALAEPLGGFYV